MPACAHTAVYTYTVCAWEPNRCVVAFWAVCYYGVVYKIINYLGGSWAFNFYFFSWTGVSEHFGVGSDIKIHKAIR
jgi:hypothetical protein